MPATVTEISPPEMEAAYLEYRRAGYEILRRHAQERGVLDALSEPITQDELMTKMEFVPARHEILGLFLRALARYGAVETDGTRYWAADDALAERRDFDPELMSRAIGKEALEALLHGSSYAGIVDTLATEENPVSSAFVAQNQKLWDEFLQTPFYSYFRDRAVNAIAAPGATVLDLAAGPGFGLQDLAREVGDDGHVLGMDISRDFVAEAVRRLREVPNVGMMQANLDQNLFFLPSSFFDGAMLVGAYHFLRNRETFVESVARALKPGGRVCLAYVYLELGSFDQELMDLRLALREPVAHPTTIDELFELGARFGLEPREHWTVGCFGWFLLERA